MKPPKTINNREDVEATIDYYLEICRRKRKKPTKIRLGLKSYILLKHRYYWQLLSKSAVSELPPFEHKGIRAELAKDWRSDTILVEYCEENGSEH